MSASEDSDQGRTLTRKDRDDLMRVARMRAKVAKQQLVAHRAKLLASIEAELAAEYDSNDPMWSELVEGAIRAVREANEEIVRQFRNRDVPLELAPRLTYDWHARGSTIAARRRAELAEVARTELDAKVESAQLELDRVEAEVLTSLLAESMSHAAQQRLETIPSASELLIAPLSVRVG